MYFSEENVCFSLLLTVFLIRVHFLFTIFLQLQFRSLFFSFATFAGAIYELCRSRMWQMRSEKPYDVPSQESLRLPSFLANHKTNHDRSGLVPQKQRLRARLACSQTGDNLKKCNRKKVYVKRRGQEETEW